AARSTMGFRRDGREAVDYEHLRNAVNEALKRTFRPELLNRIDEIIVFKPLELEHIVKIVDIMMKDLRARLAERQVEVELTEAARQWLAKEGFDPVYGARPLRRAIQRFVESPLSRKVLAGELGEGDRVVVDAGKDG